MPSRRHQVVAAAIPRLRRSRELDTEAAERARVESSPEHTWRDSHDALVAHAGRWADHPGGIVLAGYSAGRLLARRAAAAGWDLTAVEEPDLIHVYPLLPVVPEARRAFREVVEFVA